MLLTIVDQRRTFHGPSFEVFMTACMQRSHCIMLRRFLHTRKLCAIKICVSSSFSNAGGRYTHIIASSRAYVTYVSSTVESYVSHAANSKPSFCMERVTRSLACTYAVSVYSGVKFELRTYCWRLGALLNLLVERNDSNIRANASRRSIA